MKVAGFASFLGSVSNYCEINYNFDNPTKILISSEVIRGDSLQ
jgi:hypothetical protein